MAVLRTSDSRLGWVYPQAQAPFDEPGQAGHHPQPRSLALDVDVAVIRVANEPVTTPVKLPIKLVQHDVAQQRGKWRALRHALLAGEDNTVRHHDLGLQQPSDEHEQPPIRTPLSEPGHQPLVADPIKELLQIDVHHPPVPILQMLLGLLDRRVATTARPEPVTRRVERRLEHRLKYLT